MKCKGCGIEIQFENPNQKGYINYQTYQKRVNNQQEILCERCFRLKNYNEVAKVEIDEESFYQIIKDNLKENVLICNIIDAFDLDATLIKNINHLFPNNLVLVIANKYDLFMRSNRPTKIKKYIANYLDTNNIKSVGLIVTSCNDDYSSLKVYNTLLKTINAHNLNNEVFLFGMSNVGKSTLINAMNKNINGSNEFKTVSTAPSTTLNVSVVQIGDLKIYDTPGIINKKQATYYLNKKTIDLVMPNKFIKPIVFQLNPLQTIFIEGFGSVSYLSKNKELNSNDVYNNDNKNDANKNIESYNLNKLSIICYFSRNIKLHRTSYLNKEQFYSKHLDDIFRYPNKNERSKLGKIVKYQIDVDETKEVSFSGLGFIAFNSCGTVEIETFENILTVCRDKMI